MVGGSKITESKRNKEKEMVKKPRTVNLQLSELRIHRLKSLIEWERQSAERDI